MVYEQYTLKEYTYLFKSNWHLCIYIPVNVKGRCIEFFDEFQFLNKVTPIVYVRMVSTEPEHEE